MSADFFSVSAFTLRQCALNANREVANLLGQIAEIPDDILEEELQNGSFWLSNPRTVHAGNRVRLIKRCVELQFVDGVQHLLRLMGLG